MDVLAPWYPWIKALHIIAVISWMAGMLYLPRLYVYHADVPVGSPQSELFKIMERRLLRFIINPAMIVTFLFGGLLLAMPNLFNWSDGWLHAKLFAVLLLTGFHGALSRWRKDFAADKNRKSSSFYRKVNEIPTILMIFIVIMVVVRPF
ncbi:protoporphyrinogen oxidase HemJ [Govanella unica]|uniref:Protoporphyrinogen IX oxidase n=1 Tax=Govanella unica TaxID=2975056 RepID=A0A9X3TU27_9PROT|nr:protoporphyrinogen oxidase HemJ [Govania unica]MDA5192381.1 protoporphyrinogen oxidase HemJ [Govania unica]